MSTRSRAWAYWLGGSLIGVGVLGLAVMYVFTGSWGYTTVHIDRSDSVAVKGIHSLTIQGSAIDINLMAVDGSRIRVHEHGDVTPRYASGYRLVETVHDGAATIRLQRGVKWYSSIGAFNVQYVVANVQIPRTRSLLVRVESDAGNVVAKDVVAGQMALRTQAGNVTLTGFRGQRADVQAATGDVSVTGVAGVINAHSGTGDVTVSLGAVQRDVTATTSTGDVRVSIARPTKDVRFLLSNAVGNLSVNLPSIGVVMKGSRQLTVKGAAHGPVVTATTAVGDVRVAQG